MRVLTDCPRCHIVQTEQNLHTNSAQFSSKEVMCFLLLWELLNITSTLHVQLLPERFSLLQDVGFYGSKLVTKYSNGYAMYANFVFHTLSHSIWGGGGSCWTSVPRRWSSGCFPLHAIKKWLCQKQVILCRFSSEEPSNSKTAKTTWQTLAWIMGIFVASGFLNRSVSNPSRSRQHCCLFIVFWIKTKGASDWAWWSPDCQEANLGYKHLSCVFQPGRSGLAALQLPAGACPRLCPRRGPGLPERL